MRENPAPRPAEDATPYPLMTRLRPSWSTVPRPLLTVLATLLVYVIGASALLVGTVLLLAVLPGVNVALGVTSGDPASPLDVGLALAMGALWLPAGMVGVRVGGWRPLGTVWSVEARWRRVMLRALGPWVVGGALLVVAAAAVAGALVGPADGVAAGSAADAGSTAGAGSAPSVAALLALAVVVLVLAPLQAAGLELVLRGIVLQAAGTWIRTPLAGVLAAAAVTLIGRELSAPVLIPALTVAVCAAVLAWRSGGLELPIALTTALTVPSLLVSALAAGTGAGAGVAALVAGVSAPGTSGAALAAPGAPAALAGGIAAAVVLVLITLLLMVRLGRHEGTSPLTPTVRPTDLEAPAAVAV
ncbi:CAAX protease [Brachybacterium sp. J153]|uniref:CAAX protease n=1 Tax=Brachybacterium sp. J153 TaxID=3116488 RepID=UPI002E7954A8|nr:CAAX protease [Brachybacterium sp. J153]MEE1619704.1 CAAX protease [Brachybacterium sp. J153]